ncbi:MAG: DUF2752 domain-containing protein [Microthrixaceae bacterium]|nr:DUF2752 domain-containing protein [Microthrixaceae bacterium]
MDLHAHGVAHPARPVDRGPHGEATPDAAVYGAMSQDPAGPSRAARLAAPLAVGAVTLGGCIAVAAANPGDSGTPLCFSRSVFGVDCPFCGGLRATNSLIRGDLVAALDHNAILAVAMPLAVLMWVWWLVRQWRGDGPPRRLPTWIMAATGILVIAFGVVRNLGGPAWIRWIHSDTYPG